MTSFGYCRGGKKMLIFAAICDRSGITADDAQVLVVHRPEHHLVRLSRGSSVFASSLRACLVR